MGKYFGTDGFRGLAGSELTSVHAWRIGRFLAWYFGRSNGRPQVVIGKDTRRSGYMLEYSIAAGLTAGGADVSILHVTTTPCVSYITRTEGFDCGVMISASHNPYTDNGIKLIGPGGKKLEEPVLQLAEAYIDGELAALGLDAEPPFATGGAIGRMQDHDAGRNRYMGYLLSLCRHSLKGLRIGLDCANGSAWRIAPGVFGALGAKVYAIHNTPDGLNINRGCGSTHLKALQQLVMRERLDLGFAFDGDADRCLAVDEAGNVVTGDHLLYIFASAFKAAGKLDTNTVVATVMSNLGLFRALEAADINAVQTAVGDKYVYEAMAADGHSVGGEQSGHIILGQYAATGDGLLTAIQLMNVLLDAGVPLSQLASPVQLLPQMTRNVPVRDKAAVMQSTAVAAAVADLERELGKAGRILLRPSGTEPVVRVMAECSTEADCTACIDRIVAAMHKEGLI